MSKMSKSAVLRNLFFFFGVVSPFLANYLNGINKYIELYIVPDLSLNENATIPTTTSDHEEELVLTAPLRRLNSSAPKAFSTDLELRLPSPINAAPKSPLAASCSHVRGFL